MLKDFGFPPALPSALHSRKNEKWTYEQKQEGGKMDQML